jgi:hypothetical protein
VSECAASAVEVSGLASGQSGVALTALVAPDGGDRLCVPEDFVDVVVMAIPRARLAPSHPEGARTPPRVLLEGDMHHFARLARLKLTDLPSHHRLALAAGAGAVLSADDERLSAADELVALALPPLVRLRAVALLADARQALNDELAAELARAAAAVLRLVDAALSAHGRQHGYLTAAWLDRALLFAHCTISSPPHENPCPCPTGHLVDEVAEALSSVVIALHRDRLGVPEALADALSGLLVIYLSATVA